MDYLNKVFYITNKFKTRVVGKAISKGLDTKINHIDNFNKDCMGLCYGVMNETHKITTLCNNYYYTDHGWLGKSKNTGTVDGYIRVCYNSLTYKPIERRWDKFERFGLKLKPWRKNGSHIILCPPSSHTQKGAGIHNWIENTTTELKKYTDRQIIISTKSNKTPNAFSLFKNCWCLVTFHSSMLMHAMISGIPAVSTYDKLNVGKLSDIENPPMYREWLSGIPYQQWTLKELLQGKYEEI